MADATATQITDAETSPAPAPPSPIGSARLPYNAEVFKRAEEFCVSIMEAIPELDALAIVPVWNAPPENFPPAMLRFRNPMEPPMSGVLQLLQNMAKFGQALNREMLTQFQMFDNHARELAERIRHAEEQLQAKTNNQ